MTKTRAAVIALTLLTLMAFALRLYGAGSIAAYVPDTQMVREALGLGQRLASRSTLFDIGMAGALKYPLTTPYMLMGVYGGVFLGGRLTGAFPSIEAFTRWLFLSRVTVHVIAAGLVALLGALTVPVTYLITRRFASRRAAFLAAAWVAFSLLLIQFSHHARPHIPVTFFIMLAVYFSLQLHETGCWRDYLLAGLSAALAAGTLQNGVMAFVPFLVAHMLRMDFHSLRGIVRTAVNRKLMAAFVIIGIGVLATYPQLLIRPQNVVAFSRLQDSDSTPSVIALGGGMGTGFDAFQLSHLPLFFEQLFSYEPILGVIGLAGLIDGFFRRQSRTQHLILASFALLFIALFGPLNFTAPRYQSPLIPALAVTGAILIERLLEMAAARWKAMPTWVSYGLPALLVLPMVVMSLRFDQVTGPADTRTEAADWINANLPPGTGVGVESYLELLTTQASAQRQQTEFPDSLGTRDQWLLTVSADQYPSPAFAITPIYLFRSQFSDPAAIQTMMTSHEVQYAVLMQFGSALPTDRPLYDYVVANGAQVAIFCPTTNTSYSDEFPNDMHTPWTSLWLIDRPGPTVQIFRMGEAPSQPSSIPLCNA